MKDTKRRVEIYSFFNRDAICRHLEKMAAKGWMLEKMTSFTWIYRRIEPKHYCFSVIYDSGVSGFESEPSERQKRFYEFCEYAGWKLACTAEQMQIFYNEQKEPTPIETEPKLELEAIEKCAKKRFIKANVFMLAVALVWSGFFIWAFFKNPLEMLSGRGLMFSCFALLVIFLLPAVELVGYFRWIKKAKCAAEYGEFVKASDHTLFRKTIIVCFFGGLLYWFVNQSLNGESGNIIRVAGRVSILSISYLIQDKVKDHMKKQKFPEEMIRRKAVSSCVISYLILSILLFFVVEYPLSQGVFEKKNETYEHLGITYIEYQDELPLEIEDLTDISYDRYVREKNEEESPFLTQIYAEQYPRYDAEDALSTPRMGYTILEIKQPFLYEFCEKYMIREGKQNVENETKNYAEEDAAVWSAKKAYHMYHDGSGYFGQYLLCYENRIIRLVVNWKMTEEQKVIVGEKLK